MTRERMGEIALLVMRVALKENTEFDDVTDEEIEEIHQELGISKEEVREFVNEIRKQAYEEWISE